MQVLTKDNLLSELLLEFAQFLLQNFVSVKERLVLSFELLVSFFELGESLLHFFDIRGEIRFLVFLVHWVNNEDDTLDLISQALSKNIGVLGLEFLDLGLKVLHGLL